MLTENPPITTAIWACGLTVLAFLSGRHLYERLQRPTLLQPVVSGITLVSVVILGLNIDLQTYLEGTRPLKFLLNTATVALAVPLYQHRHLVRHYAIPLTLSLFTAGTLAGILALGLAYGFGLEGELLLSFGPKSITTPLAISVSREIGGNPYLATGFVIFTGLLVALISSPLFNFMKLNDELSRGIVMGISGHGIATGRAFELSPRTGVFSAVSMGLMGVYTSFYLPYLIRLAE